MTTYSSSTSDPDFYASHSTAVLEALLKRLGSEGAYVAINSGHNHPIAREYAAMLAAVLTELAKRDINLADRKAT